MSMIDPINRALRATCVKVTHMAGNDVETQGSGFFIAPQLVVTCSHVLGNLPDSRSKAWDSVTDKEVTLEKWEENSARESTEANDKGLYLKSFRAKIIGRWSKNLRLYI